MLSIGPRNTLHGNLRSPSTSKTSPQVYPLSAIPSKDTRTLTPSPSVTRFPKEAKDALAARGEAFRRKRQRWSFPKEAEGRKQVRFLRKAATPPEVKLSEGSRQRLSFFQKAARGEASFRKPPEVKLLSESRQRWSFFQKAEGTSS